MGEHVSPMTPQFTLLDKLWYTDQFLVGTGALLVERQDDGTGVGTERAWGWGKSNRHLLSTYYVPCTVLSTYYVSCTVLHTTSGLISTTTLPGRDYYSSFERRRPRESEHLAQGHTACKQQNQDVTPASLAPNPYTCCL